MSEGSIRFVCPRCQAEHRVSPQSIGHRMRCPQCQKVVRVVESPPVAHEPSSRPAWRWATPAPPPVASPAAPPLPAEAVAPPALQPIKRPKRGPIEAELDMTPMVDVTFQLLIFFMLTAAFTIQKSQPHPKPNVDQPTAVPKQPEADPDFVIVRIDSQNTYYVSGGGAGEDEVEAASPQELLIRLRQARLGAGGAVPTKLLVKAHGDCLHERVVTAIDMGNDVGIEDVKVLTVEEEEQ
jgi:biopolymer transport protein ExbD